MPRGETLWPASGTRLKKEAGAVPASAGIRGMSPQQQKRGGVTAVGKKSSLKKEDHIALKGESHQARRGTTDGAKRTAVERSNPALTSWARERLHKGAWRIGDGTTGKERVAPNDPLGHQ